MPAATACEAVKLQRKVEAVEIAVYGSFNGEESIYPVNFNSEHHFRDL